MRIYYTNRIKMDIIEKINYLIREKGFSKKEFAEVLQNLEPKLKSTGNTPNIQTIYGYLNGKRELKVELIPYIAEVLKVKEQELFNFDIEYVSSYDIRYSSEAREIVELLNYAHKNLREDILDLLREIKQLSENKMRKIRANIVSSVK